jgi:hypothetical protein
VFVAGAGDEVHSGEVHGGQAACARLPGGERVVVFEVADDLNGAKVSWKPLGKGCYFFRIIQSRGGLSACGSQFGLAQLRLCLLGPPS